MSLRFTSLSVLARGLALTLALQLAAGCSGDVLDRGNDASPVVDATPTVERPSAMPIVTPTAVVPTAEPTGTGAAVPAEHPDTYVVVEGDSLYAIALRFGVDLNALIELNGLSDPNDIIVGQELRIPPRP
ncbi:MAG TPA: LysM peptidoglycan-binding domain-containing protein [Thermomicrobiales bacterium]|nr:LysM peptidoglycan-binding domain-containing protein [Thermomicrobiales bacterium]